MPIIRRPEAAQKLKRGELVAIPTETVYGLAGRIDSDETLRSIFAVKGRPFFDPLIVHVADVHQARSLTRAWPAIYDILTQKFWPGPLTLVAPKQLTVSSLITSGLDSVALRSPNHPLTLDLLREVGIPLAAPSANRFGHTSPTTAAHVIDEFSDRVAVLDGGPCTVGVESTVLSASMDPNGLWTLEILRPGGVSRAALEGTLAEAGIKFAIERRESQVSPGHLKHHYQPDSPLILVNQDLSDAEVLRRCAEAGRTLNKINRLVLDSDPILAARALYQSFRDLSAPDTGIVFRYEPFHTSEKWEAIWDRLERAATFHWSPS